MSSWKSRWSEDLKSASGWRHQQKRYCGWWWDWKKYFRLDFWWNKQFFKVTRTNKQSSVKANQVTQRWLQMCWFGHEYGWKRLKLGKIRWIIQWMLIKDIATIPKFKLWAFRLIGDKIETKLFREFNFEAAFVRFVAAEVDVSCWQSDLLCHCSPHVCSRYLDMFR